MRIRIIEERCQGHARCAALVPDVFDVDHEGYGRVRPVGETVAEGDEQARERAQLAIDNCPEQAIVLQPDG
jgi:ferredoxin